MNSFVRLFASFLLTCMISIQCVLGFSLHVISTQTSSSTDGIEFIQVVQSNVSSDTHTYTYASTTIELPELASVPDSTETVVYADRSLLSKSTSFLL